MIDKNVKMWNNDKCRAGKAHICQYGKILFILLYLLNYTYDIYKGQFILFLSI